MEDSLDKESLSSGSFHVEESDDSLIIITADEMMNLGVKVFFTEERMQNVRKGETNYGRFNEYYGVSPYVAATVWEDLQTTTIQEARIPE